MSEPFGANGVRGARYWLEGRLEERRPSLDELRQMIGGWATRHSRPMTPEQVELLALYFRQYIEEGNTPGLTMKIADAMMENGDLTLKELIDEIVLAGFAESAARMVRTWKAFAEDHVFRLGERPPSSVEWLYQKFSPPEGAR